MIAYCIGFVAGSGATGILGLVWAFWVARRHPALRRAYEQDERERIISDHVLGAIAALEAKR